MALYRLPMRVVYTPLIASLSLCCFSLPRGKRKASRKSQEKTTESSRKVVFLLSAVVCLPDLICCHLSVQRSALWPLQIEGCR